MDKPVVQYLVEEAVASGITQVIFVTDRGKRAIEDHFDAAPELERRLEEKGKAEALKQVRSLSEMASFVYVRQREQRGDGDAILAVSHLIAEDEAVAVLFGDDIVDSETPVLGQLMRVYEKYGCAVIALQEVPPEQVNRYGIVEPGAGQGQLVEVKGFVEKPDPARAPSRMAAVGKYIVTPEIMRALREVEKGTGEELRLADAFTEVCKNGKESIYGWKFEGVRYDCGSKIGFLEATVDFGLRHPEVGEEFKIFLQNRLKK